MKPTIKLMSQWFNKFNEEYFDNELIRPNFYVSSRCTRALGKFKAYRSRNDKIISMQIVLSTFFDREEKNLQCTMIHEMIHEYVLLNYNESGHGRRFQEMCRKINKFGWNLSTTTNLEEELGTDKLAKILEQNSMAKKSNRGSMNRYIGILSEEGNNRFYFAFPASRDFVVKVIKMFPRIEIFTMKNSQVFTSLPTSGKGVRSVSGKKVKIGDEIDKLFQKNLEPYDYFAPNK